MENYKLVDSVGFVDKATRLQMFILLILLFLPGILMITNIFTMRKT